MRAVATGLVIRALGIDDEPAARAAQRELAGEGFDFLLEDHEQPWPQYLRRLEAVRQGVDLAPGRVPATYLVAEAGGELAGRLSVRHALTPWLAEWGGHLGFMVRPAFRRRGVATALLRAGLEVAADAGIARALVTCDPANRGSAATIERGGGTFERRSRPDADGSVVSRYWIDTARAASR
jgi:predicted acetyltransferase